MANDAQIVSCEGDRGTHRPRGPVPVEREGRGACFDRHPHEAAPVTPWSRVLPRVRVVTGPQMQREGRGDERHLQQPILPLLPRGAPAWPAVTVAVLAILRPHLPAHAAYLGAHPHVGPDHGLARPALPRVLRGAAATLD